MLKLEAQGKLLSIFIAPVCGPHPPPAGGYERIHPMEEVDEVEALQDRGLRGDRWLDVKEFRLPNGNLKPFARARQVSLISNESIKKLQETLEIEAIQLRRNLLVEGITLEDKVGELIQIGDVILEGTGLCHPCKHIEEVTVPGVRKLLHNKGGLRAKIIQGGTLKKGDRIWHKRG